MAFNKQKLLRFKKLILEDVNLQINNMKNLRLNYEKKELETTKNEFLNKIFIDMQNKVKFLNESYSKKINQTELFFKNEILVYRNNLIKQIHNQCKKNILNFVKTSAYKTYLFNSIEKTCINLNLNNSIIIISPIDLNLKNEILNLANFNNVEVDDLNELGGFKLILQNKNVLIDRTLKTLFELSFQKFYKNCKLAISLN